MNRWTPFIQGTELLAVTYTTEAPEEKVHPWVSWEPDFNDYKVSLFKKPVPLTAFLTRLARHEPGLRVRSRRHSNKRTTSIAFNKTDRVEFDPVLLVEMASLV